VLQFCVSHDEWLLHLLGSVGDIQRSSPSLTSLSTSTSKELAVAEQKHNSHLVSTYKARQETEFNSNLLQVLNLCSYTLTSQTNAYAVCVLYTHSPLLCWETGPGPSLTSTPSIPNYKTFDFFDTKFDHSSYSKICAKYQFFYRGLVY
jgi:hypothetical protein